MLNDIITEHKERMLNLKKYYPFFKLMDVSFAQFQEGRYEMLDMGYIVMGILRFFIEENNFKEKDVTYPEYLDFITSLLKRDFGLNLSAQEYKELADYIFDKIKNEGRPFTFPYYDPIEKKKCISRIKVLESAIRDHTVWYSISSDAIEFYLDTKEIKEESRISVQQLLLEKMRLWNCSAKMSLRGLKRMKILSIRVCAGLMKKKSCLRKIKILSRVRLQRWKPNRYSRRVITVL